MRRRASRHHRDGTVPRPVLGRRGLVGRPAGAGRRAGRADGRGPGPRRRGLLDRLGVLPRPGPATRGPAPGLAAPAGARTRRSASTSSVRRSGPAGRAWRRPTCWASSTWSSAPYRARGETTPSPWRSARRSSTASAPRPSAPANGPASDPVPPGALVAGRALMAAFGLFTAVGLANLGRLCGGRGRGLAALAFAAHPIAVEAYTRIGVDILALGFAVAAVNLLVVLVRRDWEPPPPPPRRPDGGPRPRRPPGAGVRVEDERGGGGRAGPGRRPGTDRGPDRQAAVATPRPAGGPGGRVRGGRRRLHRREPDPVPRRVGWAVGPRRRAPADRPDPGRVRRDPVARSAGAIAGAGGAPLPSPRRALARGGGRRLADGRRRGAEDGHDGGGGVVVDRPRVPGGLAPVRMGPLRTAAAAADRPAPRRGPGGSRGGRVASLDDPRAHG